MCTSACVMSALLTFVYRVGQISKPLLFSQRIILVYVNSASYCLNVIYAYLEHLIL